MILNRQLAMAASLAIASIAAVVSSPAFAESEKCQLEEYTETQRSDVELMFFVVEKACSDAEVSRVAIFRESDVLFNMISSSKVDYVIANKAMFALWADENYELAVAYLTGVAAAQSEFDSVKARDLRFFSAALREDVYNRLEWPRAYGAFAVAMEAFAVDNAKRFFRFYDLVPFCVLMTMQYDVPFEVTARSAEYSACVSSAGDGWSLIVKLIAS